jgi:uncharacterized protein (DUF2141 family)
MTGAPPAKNLNRRLTPHARRAHGTNRRYLQTGAQIARRWPAILIAAVTGLAGGTSLMALGLTQPSLAADLEIRLTGMKSNKGSVHFGLYHNAEEFPGGDSVAGDNKLADQSEVVFLVPDLPPGRYAIAAFHDSNGNGEHDVSIFRIEDFAFSQGAKAIFSAPDFADAAFDVPNTGTSVTIDFSD